MKKIIAILIIGMCLLAPAFSDSITKFGMNCAYNSVANLPEMGMYMSTSFIDSRSSRPVSLGFGMRVDMNGTLPTDRMDVNFISGMSLDFKLKYNWGLEILVGPSFGVTTIFNTARDEGMTVGAGTEIAATYYLDGNRTSGVTLGISGSDGMYLPDNKDESPEAFGQVAGFLGFTFRTNHRSMVYGSNDIYITL